jgi:hypothetical protein
MAPAKRGRAGKGLAAHVGLAIASAGCHSNVVLDPLPASDGARSVLVIGHDAERGLWVEAFDSGERPPELHFTESVDLHAVELGCPLERLGLARGTQRLLDTPAQALRIPRPRRAWSTRIDDGRWSEGVLSPVGEETLRRLDVPNDNLCEATRAEFFTRKLDVPADGHGAPVFSVALDEESALVGSVDGRVYRAHRDGRVELLSSLSGLGVRAAYVRPGGEIWLLSAVGLLSHGRLGAPFETMTATAPLGLEDEDEIQVALAGPTVEGAPFELFAATNARRFIRFDGVEWRTIARVEHRGIFVAAVAWIGEQHAVAIGMGQTPNTVVRYFRGSITEEALPTGSGVSSILHHAALGTVVGMDDGSLAVRADQGWTPLFGGPDVRYVRTLLAEGDGFLFGASTEVNFLSYGFGQYLPEIGFCEPRTLTDLAAIFVAPLGEDTFLATTLQSFDYPLELTLLDRTARSGDCTAYGD